MSHPRASLRGALCIAAAAALWALSATAGRAVFTGWLGGESTPLDPIILSQSRTTLSLLVLVPAVWMALGRDALRLPAADRLRALAVGVAGMAAANFFYYDAIQRTTVATAIIVQYTAPVWVLLWMVGRGRQRATPARLGAVALAVGGIVLATGLTGEDFARLDRRGLTSALLSAFAFAITNVGGRELVARHARWPVLVWTLAGASGFWLLVNPPWKVLAAGYGAEQWGFLGVFAMASLLVPFILYFTGLAQLDATRAVVLACLEPIFAVLCAALLLGERLGAIQGVGMALVLAATILIERGVTRSPAR